METDLYKRSDHIIGVGEFGTVFKGHQKNHNRTPVAIKRMVNDEKCVTGNAMKDFKAMLAVCGHENIVQLLELHRQPDFIYIIMEYCNRGDLDSFLSEGVPSYKIKLDIMRQCAAGVSYIHGLYPPVVHRDLKPQNILLHESPSGVIWVKLGDFGLAKVFSDMTGSIGDMYMYTGGGTVPFIAPEMWKSKQHFTAKVDNYAMGLVYAIIVNYSDSDKERLPHTAGVARKPYLAYGLRQFLAHDEHRPQPSLYLSPQFAENHPRMEALIVDMTSFNAIKRPKMQKVESEIDQEISDENEEAASGSPSAVSHPVSYRKTDRRLDSIKRIIHVKESSFKIRKECWRMCYHNNVFYFPCLYNKCIDCYSMEGSFIRSISLSPHKVGFPNSVHALTENSLLLAAWSGLYEVDTGEGGECCQVLQEWCVDVHVSEGVVAVLVRGDTVHILQASDLSSPGRTITLTAHSETRTVLLHQNSLCVSSGIYDGAHSHISVYSLSTGELTSQYGRRGFGAAGELVYPRLSVCDAEGGLLVVGRDNHRLQTHSARGEWAVLPGLREVGVPCDAVIVGDHMLVLDDVQNVHAYKITYKSNSKTTDASKSNSKTKDTSKSNSETKDTSKSNSEAKDTRKSNSETQDTTKSNSKTKDTSKSNSKTKDTSKSNSETKDPSKSNSETKDTSRSNSETKDTSKSNFETKDTCKSKSETRDTGKCNSETSDTSKSNSETKDTSKSNSETKDTSKSNSETKDTNKSYSEKQDTSKSYSEKQDTSKSNSEIKDTSKSNSLTKDTSKSSSETKDTGKSNSETTDTSKSNSKCCLII